MPITVSQHSTMTSRLLTTSDLNDLHFYQFDQHVFANSNLGWGKGSDSTAITQQNCYLPGYLSYTNS